MLEELKADVHITDEVALSLPCMPTSRVCQYGRTPLIQAAAGGHLDCVRFLALEAKLDVNAQDKVRKQTPIRPASCGWISSSLCPFVSVSCCVLFFCPTIHDCLCRT